MQLSRFTQAGFRNLQLRGLNLTPGLVGIQGPNGSGKSNLLLGISVALGGELGREIQDLLAFGQQEARLEALAVTEIGELRVTTRLAGAGREIWLNESPARINELRRYPSAVLLAPPDLDLILGAPEGRRRWLDSVLARFSSNYARFLSRYQRALRQRNSLLKLGQSAGMNEFTTQLALNGEAILDLRRRFLTQLAPRTQAIARQLGHSETELKILESSSGLPLAEALASREAEERQRGLTLSGPHRDDLQIFLAGRLASQHASRGQARTLAAALRLAEHNLLSAHYGEPPLLLLDDLTSEFDSAHQEAILTYAQTLPQVIISGTTLPAGIDKVFGLEAGELRG